MRVSFPFKVNIEQLPRDRLRERSADPPAVNRLIYEKEDFMNKKSFTEKAWEWAMNNTTVSACLFTLALGLAFGLVCTILDMMLC